MSGIAGIARRDAAGIGSDTLARMAAAIRHRGPDGYGFYLGASVGLAHVWLSALDLDGGAQPLTNEDAQIIITCNGNIYNDRELRSELEARGHVFRTRSDTEALLHGYEEWGVEVLNKLDGQFAFVIYDRRRERLFLARDRFGINPLFYAQRNGDFYFGSEVKAILATGEVDAALDPRGLEEVLTFGAAKPPRTPFSGIASLEPGTYGLWEDGALWLRHYYELDYPEASDEPADAIEQLDEIMLRSAGMRLRADVPVGAHVSGGIDSSVAASLARAASSTRPQSFSIALATPDLDETMRQSEAAVAAGTAHTALVIQEDSVARSLSEVVWHAETPLLSTSSALMYHLARLTKESGFKIVVGGHGADEIFLGNHVFKEAAVRRFCLRRPTSCVRERLFDRLNSIQSDRASVSDPRFLLDVASPGDPLFSHLPRFLGARVDGLYAREFSASLGGIDVIGELRASLPTRFFGWSAASQAAYLEMSTFFSPCILSAQTDRMNMAHGVEVRSPFLDHRLFEFAAALPASSHLCGLKGKGIFRRWASRILNLSSLERRSDPSLNDAQSCLAQTISSSAVESLTQDSLRKTGIFSATTVGHLVSRCSSGAAGAGETRSLIGVISTQLWHRRFIENTIAVAPLPLAEAAVLLTDDRPPAPRRGGFQAHADIGS